MNIKIYDYGCVKLPERQHPFDAGLDVFSPVDIELKPGKVVIIPLQFGVDIPHGFYGYLIERSSMAMFGIKVSQAPIDSGYTGSIHAIISNITKDITYKFRKGDRIAQLVIAPCLLATLTLNIYNERGNNGLGSTGK